MAINNNKTIKSSSIPPIQEIKAKLESVTSVNPPAKPSIPSTILMALIAIITAKIVRGHPKKRPNSRSPEVQPIVPKL
ncbi:hypothetical protein THIOM_002950 [Candidatus Thiomargarita nelsonii]|uniref:Uncharacterized protein n=1 Tax=Candidatus Thiomargarita nelsonii TaxID=1003181 RepID=A0A176S054_9GAMM|nr:hypothetical protein THIOM_002950 [Candidatus Thiomargarita nelsonii]